MSAVNVNQRCFNGCNHDDRGFVVVVGCATHDPAAAAAWKDAAQRSVVTSSDRHSKRPPPAGWPAWPID